MELNTELISGVSGHAHKTDFASTQTYNNNLQWNSIGHTADKELVDKNCGYSKEMRWTQGFALIRSRKDWFDVENIVYNNKGFFCKYNQKEYKK